MTNQPSPSGGGNGGRVTGLLNAVRGLTLSNVLVLAALAVIAVPAFVVYQAVTGNDALLDRLLSTYELVDSDSDCIIRHVQERGGPELWSIGAGFAYQGRDRWSVNVLLLNGKPGEDEIATYCEALKLIVDKMLTGDLNGP
jgi:hypothetical protein